MDFQRKSPRVGFDLSKKYNDSKTDSRRGRTLILLVYRGTEKGILWLKNNH